MMNFTEFFLFNNFLFNKEAQYKKPGRQSGIALLLSIMIVALVSIVSVTIITQRHLQIYRTSNLYFHDQAYQYSLGIERWGLSALSQDFEKDKKENKLFDSHQDIWNSALVNFDVEQATIDGVIFDLQGRFNLNNLVFQGKVQTKWLASYKRLLDTLDLPPSLASTLVDWLDANELPTGESGAEDIFYIALEQPYRTANQPLVHLSELLLIKDYNEDVLNVLKPYVFVAPSGTPVNINTSSVKVLRAIIPDFSDNQAGTLMTQIEGTPFTTVEDFLKEQLLKNKLIEKNQISVQSNYFVVNSRVSINKTKINLQTLINRNEQGDISIVARQESLLYDKVIPNDKSE